MNSKKSRDIVLMYVYLYGVIQLLLVRETLYKKRDQIWGKVGLNMITMI